MAQRTDRSTPSPAPRLGLRALSAIAALALWLALPFAALAQEDDEATLQGDFSVTITKLDVPQDLPNGAMLLGRWRISFAPDGTYAAERQDVGTLVTGTYEVDGNRVVITDADGILACGAGGDDDLASGTYEWDASGERVTLTRVEDQCGLRSVLLATRNLASFVACLTQPLSTDGLQPEATPEATATEEADDPLSGLLTPEAEATPGADTGSAQGDDTQAITQAIDDLLGQMTACWATGQPDRWLPLLSDDFRNALIQSDPNFLQGLAAAMGAPIIWERAGDVDVDDASHASAIVRQTLGEEEDFVRFSFVLEDGEWRWNGGG